MYKKIINPKTGKSVNVNGKVGREVLNNYFKQSGGFKVPKKTVAKNVQKGGSRDKRRSPKKHNKKVNQRGGGENKFMIFHAEWCGHCRNAMNDFKKLHGIFGENKGITLNKKNVKVELIDVDQNKELASKYGVNSFPTLKLVKEDNKIEEYNGDRSWQHMTEWISDQL